jgi:hypothetical protein
VPITNSAWFSPATAHRTNRAQLGGFMASSPAGESAGRQAYS